MIDDSLWDKVLGKIKKITDIENFDNTKIFYSFSSVPCSPVFPENEFFCTSICPTFS